MKLRTLLLTLVMATFVGAAFAHGGGEHVKGKVTAIGDGSITVLTVKGESKVIAFDQSSKFLKSGSPATVQDLKVGDKVVIDIHDMNGKLHAAQVRFGAPKKADANHSGHQQQQEKR